MPNLLLEPEHINYAKRHKNFHDPVTKPSLLHVRKPPLCPDLLPAFLEIDATVDDRLGGSGTLFKRHRPQIQPNNLQWKDLRWWRQANDEENPLSRLGTEAVRSAQPRRQPSRRNQINPNADATPKAAPNQDHSKAQRASPWLLVQKTRTRHGPGVAAPWRTSDTTTLTPL